VAAAELGDQVDLLAAMFFAHVAKAGFALGDGQLGSQLAGEEGVEEPAEELAFAQHGEFVDAQQRGGQRRVGDVAFRAGR
jgi:hypothetical protein